MEEWSPARRVAFRFGFVLGVLYLYPLPLGLIPKTDWLAEILAKPFEWLASWCATAVLGTGEPSFAQTGSGDTLAAYVTFLVILVLAAAGAALWSALDRRRAAYPRLAAGAIVVLRYYLAWTLLSYAFAKLFQFPPPGPGRLDQRVGDMSPMGMLWTFMGSSRPYALFAGGAEALGGVLLLWRRTHVAGALIAAAAMANVVALNFCYDVPVKLYSMQLLLIALLLFAPHARRVIGAMLGLAAPEVPPRALGSPRLERARLAAGALGIVLIAAYLYQQHDQSSEFRKPRHELHGIWVVEELVLDGTERPPLLTDAERWHKIHFTEHGATLRPMNGPLVGLGAKVDPAQRTIAIKGDERWRYTLSTEGERATLVLDGTFRGKPLHAELQREPEPLLVTRGFHWINEIPFNR